MMSSGKDCKFCGYCKRIDAYSEGEQLGECRRFPHTLAPVQLVDTDRIASNDHPCDPSLYAFPIVWLEGYACGEFVQNMYFKA